MDSAHTSFEWTPQVWVEEDSMVTLRDRADIIDVTYRYAWALDTRCWSDLDDIFTVDATAHLPVPMQSREAIRAHVRSILEPLDASQHMVTNHQIVLRGDTASCRCQLQAQHVRTRFARPDHYLVGGQYVDRFVRTPDGWRIADRRLSIAWTQGDPTVVRPERKT